MWMDSYFVPFEILHWSDNMYIVASVIILQKFENSCNIREVRKYIKKWNKSNMCTHKHYEYFTHLFLSLLYIV